MEPKIITQRNETFESAWKAIIVTGLSAGTLDAIAAIVVYQANPVGLFQFIASGAFGAGKAFSGGLTMAFWGMLFHYIIAFSWTIVFFFMYPVFPFMRKNKYLTGLLYGIVVWVMMNRVVLPLSQISQGAFNIRGALIGASILMVAVGLPISLLTHRYYARKGTLRIDE